MENISINEIGVFDQRPVRREKDSVDDFEHLGLESSPTQGDADLATSVSAVARDLLSGIDKAAESIVNQIDDEIQKQPLEVPDNLKIDVNLYEKGDTLLGKGADDKMDKYISQLASFAPAVPSHDVSPLIEDRKPQYDDVQNFLDMEREKVYVNEPINVEAKEPPKFDDLLTDDTDIYEEQPFELPTEKHTEWKEPPVVDDLVFETINPPASKIEPVFAERHHILSEPILEPHKIELPQVPKSAPPIISGTPAPVSITQPIIEPPKNKPLKIDVRLEPVLTDAEVIFKKMGLDAWFHPERLNPRVESLIYWRDPTKSGPVFGGVLVVLLALTYLSLISVIAYLSLLALTATISFRIYKNVLQAVQKTGDGHPFKEFLEKDLTLPQDKVKEFVETAIAHINAAGVELRRLFLVDDLVDSIKFGVLLWCLTYLGAWFNGMTLVIIAWVALFTLPKVYETNKTQIDANLDLVRSKIAEITSKVKAAIPIGKKEEKKEQ